MMDMRERNQEAARAQQPETSVHASATYIINSRRSQDRVTPILDGTASYSVAQNSHHSNIANFELPHRTDSPHVGFEDVPRRDSPLSVSMVQQQHVVHRLEESDSEEERRDRRRRHEEYFQSLPRDSIFTSDSVYLRAIQIRLRENSEYFLYGDSVYETVRTCDGVVVELGSHLERLRRSGQGIGLEVPFDDARINAALAEKLLIIKEMRIDIFY